jgi:hypothetical protein
MTTYKIALCIGYTIKQKSCPYYARLILPGQYNRVDYGWISEIPPVGISDLGNIKTRRENLVFTLCGISNPKLCYFWQVDFRTPIFISGPERIFGG